MYFLGIPPNECRHSLVCLVTRFVLHLIRKQLQIFFFVSNLHKFFLSWRCLIKTKGTFFSYFFIHLATSSFQMNPYDFEMLLDGEWICYDYCENTLKLDRKFLLLLYNMSMVVYL